MRNTGKPRLTYTEAEAVAVVEWLNSDQGTERYVKAEDVLIEMHISPTRAKRILGHLRSTGRTVDRLTTVLTQGPPPR